MQSMIVRKKVLKFHSEVWMLSSESRFLHMTSYCNFKDVKHFLEVYGLKHIMSELYGETINSEVDIQYLKDKYTEVKTTKEENDLFTIVYKVNSRFCLYFSDNGNIYFCSYLKRHKIKKMDIVPWDYLGSTIYIGNIRGSDKLTVIKDILNLSFVKFIDKYQVFDLSHEDIYKLEVFNG